MSSGGQRVWEVQPSPEKWLKAATHGSNIESNVDTVDADDMEPSLVQRRKLVVYVSATGSHLQLLSFWEKFKQLFSHTAMCC